MKGDTHRYYLCDSYLFKEPIQPDLDAPFVNEVEVLYL